MSTRRMPVNWIGMIGLYSEGQYQHVLDGLTTLSMGLPFGEQHTVIVYTRPNLVLQLYDLLLAIRESNPSTAITLMGGLSLHGGTPDDVWDYVYDEPYRKPYAVGAVYAPSRWRRIAQLVSEVAAATQNNNVAIVSEPDPWQLEKLVRFDWRKLAAAWRRAAGVKCRLWVDQPTIAGWAGRGIADVSYAETVAWTGQATDTNQPASKLPVQFMPLEPTSAGVIPMSTDWRAQVGDAWGARVTAGCNVHFRFAVAARATEDGSWPWTIGKLVGGWPTFAARWPHYGAPVLYVNHNDWVTVCKQIVACNQ